MLPFSIMNHYGNVVVRDDYKRFVDELRDNSTNKLVTGNGSYSAINTSTYSRIYMFGSTVVGGTMWGTPYGSRMTWDSSFGHAIQHCFPTQALYNDFIASTNDSRVVCLVRSAITSGSSYISLSRNGYTSSTYGTFSGLTVDQFIYYDPNTARVMTYNPGTMSTPTFYYT